MVIQDRVMKLEGGEQDLASSCHRLNCKSMVFMYFVPYKYMTSNNLFQDSVVPVIQGQESILFTLCS